MFMWQQNNRMCGSTGLNNDHRGMQNDLIRLRSLMSIPCTLFSLTLEFDLGISVPMNDKFVWKCGVGQLQQFFSQALCDHNLLKYKKGALYLASLIPTSFGEVDSVSA